VVRNEPAKQPHHLEIAPGLALKPPARLHPVEVAVNVKLQKNRRVIGRPARRLRLNPGKAEFSKIERGNERVDHPNRIILVNPIIEALGQKRRLTPIRSLDKALHRFPRDSSASA
jgi:hypothetical protein